MANIYDEHLPPLNKESTDEGSGRRSKKREVEGISGSGLRGGKIRLVELAGQAFETLHNAMRFADYPTAVSAAKLVLDRSGFGPTSTLKIDDGIDLSDLSSEELAAFAFKIGRSARKQSDQSIDLTKSSSDQIH